MQAKPRRSQLLQISRRPSQRTLRARQVTHVVAEDRLVGFGDTDEAEVVTAAAAAAAAATGRSAVVAVVVAAAVGGLLGRRWRPRLSLLL